VVAEKLELLTVDKLTMGEMRDFERMSGYTMAEVFTLPEDAVPSGVVLALAGTWGFHGVFWFSIVRAYPATPGRVTGTTTSRSGPASSRSHSPAATNSTHRKRRHGCAPC
jgi:hypothetical protein